MNKNKQKELLLLVEKNYKEVSSEYSETRKKEIWPNLRQFLEKIPVGARILDIGCGSAKVLQVLKDKNIKYLGVDPSKELLDMARKDFTGFQFKVGNILNLGEVPGLNYDYVLCVAVLHHIPGEDLRVKALKQLKNKVADGGKIILSVWNLWESKKHNKLIWKFLFLKLLRKNEMDFGDITFDWLGPNKKSSKRYYHAFTLRELKKLCKKAGLRVEEELNDDYNLYLVLSVI